MRRGAALVRQGFLEHAPHALAHTLREFLARLEPVETLAPRLAELRIPTLVIAGARDAASLPTCRALAAALPDAALVVIPDAGHVVNLAAPAAFDAALLDFRSARRLRSGSPRTASMRPHGRCVRQLAQPAERIDAGLVAVAPGDLDGVAADALDAQRVHVLGNGGGIEPALARPLVHALGAGAGEA